MKHKFYKLRKKLRLLYKPDSYLVLSGYIRSLNEGYPCKSDCTPVPWMNYNVISFLEGRLTKDMRLFEYGSGYSTLFYSNLVKEVVSIESDIDWYNRMKKLISDNVQLYHVDFKKISEYCGYINKTDKKYDVVVIDGRNRNLCVKNAIDSLSEKGVIIFDDTSHAEYSEGVKDLLNHNFRKLDFEGLKACGFGLDRTSIFYKANNCLNL
jgi:hypothetical protein